MAKRRELGWFAIFLGSWYEAVHTTPFTPLSPLSFRSKSSSISSSVGHEICKDSFCKLAAGHGRVAGERAATDSRRFYAARDAHISRVPCVRSKVSEACQPEYPALDCSPSVPATRAVYPARHNWFAIARHVPDGVPLVPLPGIAHSATEEAVSGDREPAGFGNVVNTVESVVTRGPLEIFASITSARDTMAAAAVTAAVSTPTPSSANRFRSNRNVEVALKTRHLPVE